MSSLRLKQPVLKPQDLLVALKFAVNEDRILTFIELGHELSMSASEVHAASRRAENSRLLIREFGQIRAARSSLLEFILHGVKYAFPAVVGSISRGMPTATGASPLKEYFSQNDLFIFVWPDPEGTDKGQTLVPLYPSVPTAAREDPRLYKALVLVDALRIGAAREREIATSELKRLLS